MSSTGRIRTAARFAIAAAGAVVEPDPEYIPAQAELQLAGTCFPDIPGSAAEPAGPVAHHTAPAHPGAYHTAAGQTQDAPAVHTPAGQRTTEVDLELAAEAGELWGTQCTQCTLVCHTP